MSYRKTTIEYGRVGKSVPGFWYWFIGGKAFGEYAGEFTGPFETLEKAKAAAEKAGAKERVNVVPDPGRSYHIRNSSHK